MFFKSKICSLITLGVHFFVLIPLSVNSFLLEGGVRAKLRHSKLKKAETPLEGATKEDVGDRLFLSPLIEKGDYTQAQEKAIVPPFLPGIESFTGYITVNKTCESNTFFWLFKSFEGDWKTKPLIVWLQGGPGASSLFGLFGEMGPYNIDARGKLEKRKYSWNQKYNLMFIDNPVGTGFSFTNHDSGFATSQLDTAKDLYSFIVQFYAMFPALEKNPFYIMGESYAGKFVPSFAHYIHLRNKENKSKGKGFVVPLAAVAVGNGFIDPFYMMNVGDYLYQLGFIDHGVREQLNQFEGEGKALIKAKEYVKANYYYETIFATVYNVTGLDAPYNYINDVMPSNDPLDAFLDKPKTRRALHVGNQSFSSLSDAVSDHMNADFMQPVIPTVEDILNWEAFDFVSYSGQLDIICAYPFSVNIFRHLKWKHAADYKKAKRCAYLVDDRVEGYFKTTGVFTEIMLRNCGHMVPTDSPKVASHFLDMFVTNRTGFKCA